MIVSFSVKNFRSFSTEETISFVASSRNGTAHPSHVVAIPKSKEKVLQATVIYGANGAGKSNLFKALRFMRFSAIGTRHRGSGTGREAFAFGNGSSESSSFDLQFIIDEKLYRFGFKLDDAHVLEEWLVQVIGAREKIIYERVTGPDGTVKIEAPGIKGKKLQALATVGGRQNQTFLATVHATLEESDFGSTIGPIITWLRDDLQLIAPTQSFQGLAHHLSEDPGFLEFAGDYLKASSTGVDRLAVEKKEIDEEELRRRLPKELVEKIIKDLEEDKLASVRISDGDELIIEKTSGNRYHLITIGAEHENRNGPNVSFRLEQESDGTRRLLNLLPALYHLRRSNAVYFIDEIDRSMHPILARKFLEFFLKSCGGGKRQIIVTTHESTLLDLDLLRRDEIWFAEKDNGGSTRLYSLVDFKVRTDLEIRKHYLQGRFGAIPFLGNLDGLINMENTCP